MPIKISTRLFHLFQLLLGFVTFCFLLKLQVPFFIKALILLGLSTFMYFVLHRQRISETSLFADCESGWWLYRREGEELKVMRLFSFFDLGIFLLLRFSSIDSEEKPGWLLICRVGSGLSQEEYLNLKRQCRYHQVPYS